MTERRTGFVLSGGSSLGAQQAGMLRALYEQGITADLLVGTSAGTINAAFVASRPQTEATARELARIWRDLQQGDVFPVSMRALVGGLCRKRDHLVPDHALRRLVSRYLEYEDFADATTPLHVVADDMIGGGQGPPPRPARGGARRCRRRDRRATGSAVRRARGGRDHRLGLDPACLPARRDGRPAPDRR